MNKQRLRRISLVLLLLHLQSIVVPPALQALTSGPAAPEFSSFEPVDATDMVHLNTGDFNYTVPLLEIPGPNGGYPLALSYHSGITVEQQASWVGLGWTLNAGALNRDVHGFADDWRNKTIDVLAHDDGGTYKWQQVTVGYGFEGASVGIGVSWDSNKSIGFSLYAAYGVPGMLGVTASVSSNGQASVGITASNIGPLNLRLDQTGVNVGVGYGPMKVSLGNQGLDYSIDLPVGGGAFGISLSSSSGGKVIVSLAGYDKGTDNAQLGKVSTETTTEGLSIPLGPVNIGYSEANTRWWIDQRTAQIISGPLYAPVALQPKGDRQSPQLKMDTYYNAYSDETYRDNIKNDADNNPLTFPNYDSYIVTAQGITGSISPRPLEHGYLVKETKVLESDEIGLVFKSLDYFVRFGVNPYSGSEFDNFEKSGNQIHFLFDHEPTSHYEVNGSTFTISPNDPYQYNYQTSSSHTSRSGKSTYNQQTKRLGGSKFIEWYSERDIHSGAAKAKGFVEAPEKAQQRNRESYQIGGFSITAEDGKTYHFSLPVYQRGEVRVIQNTANMPGPGSKYLHHLNGNEYAYTWLLTAITGPDYVDRDGSGTITQGDWGYWVRFNYGKWTGAYFWKDPYQGTTKDGANWIYNFGVKELYYLNSVETASHVAYFFKSLREDGMGATVNFSTPERAYGRLMYVNESCSAGGTEPASYKIQYNVKMQFVGKCDVPTRVLKLDKILLMKKTTESIVSAASSSAVLINNSTAFFSHGKELQITKVERTSGNCGDNLPPIWGPGYEAQDQRWARLVENPEGTYVGLRVNGGDGPYSGWLRGDNSDRLSGNYGYGSHLVLDMNDFQAVQNSLMPKALKIIDFNYDYSLASNTPNSAPVSAGSTTKHGKLTLKSFQVQGHGGNAILPPYVFEYNTDVGNAYSSDSKDQWGYNAYGTSKIFSPDQDGLSKAAAATWNLKEILLPTGASIRVHYENDTYRAEAALGPVKRTLTMQWDRQKSAFYNPHIQSNAQWDAHLTVGQEYDVSVPYDLYYGGGGGGPVIQSVQSQTASSVESGVSRQAFTGKLKLTSIGADGSLRFDFTPVWTQAEESCPTTACSYQLVESEGAISVTSKWSYGGGIRTRRIDVVDPLANEMLSTEYDYSDPATGGSSGMTSYAARKDDRYIPYVHEIPAPDVTYEYVTVKQIGSDGRSVGGIRHRFEVLSVTNDPKSQLFRMGNHFWIEDLGRSQKINPSGSHITAAYYRSSVVHNNLSSLGRPIKIEYLDANNRTLQSTNYQYFVWEHVPQGIRKETYAEVKLYQERSSTTGPVYRRIRGTSSGRVFYPSLLMSTTSSANSVVARTENMDYDIYTGNVLKTKFTTATGEVYYTESVPAYTKYPAMGSKIWSSNYANMLVQEMANYTYRENPGPIIIEGQERQYLAASVQTWDNAWSFHDYNPSNGEYAMSPIETGAWRKKANYVWRSALDPKGHFGAFTRFDPQAIAPGWLKTGEVSRYNRYSQELESRDINGQYAALRVGYSASSLPIAFGAAAYGEITACGFEEDANAHFFEGEVRKGSMTRVSAAPVHTGGYAGRLTSGSVDLFKFKSKGGKTVRASIWVHASSPAATAISLHYPSQSSTLSSARSSVTTVRAGDWYLVSVEGALPARVSEYETIVRLTASNTAVVDDFRFHPIDAPLSSYVYDERTNLLTAILDAACFATWYKYDSAGRLTEIWREVEYKSAADVGGFKLLSKGNMNYARRLKP